MPRRPEPDPWIETLAWLMDNSIRIGRWRIGLDALLGLVPGAGDVAGTAASALMGARAAAAGLPRATVLRMVLNVAIDTLLGSLPLVGDLFDFVFKSNARNLALYRAALAGGGNPRRDAWFAVLVCAVLALLLAVPVLALVWLVSRVT
jgi:hypothetical protein